MVRIQVQLTPAQVKNLKQLSRTTGRSVAELVRQGVDQILTAQNPAEDDKWERARRLSGMFSFGPSDLAENHDRYLAEIDK